MRLLPNQFSCLPRVYKILICIMRILMHYEKVYCIWLKIQQVQSFHMLNRFLVSFKLVPSIASRLGGSNHFPQRSKWSREHPVTGPSSTLSHDSIESYLNTPCISDAEILSAGGILKYWDHMHATRPRLAQMALDYLSAPGMYLESFVLHHIRQPSYSNIY
jgi:hypothetical protein